MINLISYLNTKICLLLVCMCLVSCEKGEEYPLPDVNVNEYLNLSNAENTNLRVPGGLKTITGGVNGIIIYRISESEFGVFDRACPNEPDEDCAVNAEGAIAVCPCCNSVYSLLDGSLIDGVSKWPVKAYHTSFNGTTLMIYN